MAEIGSTKDPLARRRVLSHWAVGLGTIAIFLFTRGIPTPAGQFQVTLESGVATWAAVVIGALALVRYYSRQDIIYLLIGAGFLGTACLEAFHALAVAGGLGSALPSSTESQIRWSWLASRLILSIMLTLSYVAWSLDKRFGMRARPRDRWVFALVIVLTGACLLVSALAPSPPPFFPDQFVSSPAEYAPAAFFAMALVGYLVKGGWRTEGFEHWLVLALILGFVDEALVVPSADQPYDFTYMMGYVLKIIGNVLVLIGLMTDIFQTFQREKSASDRTQAVVNNIVDGVITIDHRGIIQSANTSVERIFGYSQDEILGQKVMILAAEPYRSAHDSYIANYLATGKPKIIGTGREVVGMRRDGETFPMDLTVTKLWVGKDRLFLGVVRDLSERTEMDRMKNEFVSTVSHELRTPLTSIRGSLGMIATMNSGNIPGPIMRMIELAERNTERLINLVNDLLDMEKIQAGEMKLRAIEINIELLVEKAIEANRPYTQQFGATIRLTSSASSAEVLGDPDRLTQVLENLLSNAAKYSPQGGVIDVSVAMDGARVHVSIKDTGAGIPVEFQNRIFQRFTQADSSDTRVKGGTGLGLSISKAIVEIHGGAIGFESEEGKGSTFFFHLPISGYSG